MEGDGYCIVGARIMDWRSSSRLESHNTIEQASVAR